MGLPDMDVFELQQYIDAMYEAGLIIKDDGLTVYFSPAFAQTTGQRSYFDSRYEDV